MDKETMIRETARLLQKLFYEDIEFIYKFVAGYAARKGIA